MRGLVADLFVAELLPQRGKPPSERAKRRHEAWKLDFLRMCNGPLQSGRLVHYCHPSVGCGCTSREDSVRRFSQAVTRIMYNRRPPVPQVTEWTSVRQSMAFLALPLLTGGLHRDVFECSIRPKRQSGPQAVQGSGGDFLQLVPAPCLPDGAGAGVESSIADSDWHAMVGQRTKFVSEKLMQPTEDSRKIKEVSSGRAVFGRGGAELLPAQLRQRPARGTTN